MSNFFAKAALLVSLPLSGNQVLAQDLSENEMELRGLNFFVEQCVATAPSFQGAMSNGTTEHASVEGGKVRLFDVNGKCSCTTPFVVDLTRVIPVDNGLFTVVEEFAGDAVVSSRQFPTKIELLHDETPSTVRLALQDSDRADARIAMPTIEREGACPV